MKIARALAAGILLLCLLSLYGWWVKNASTGAAGGGRITRALRTFVGFPDEVKQVFGSSRIQGVPDSYLKIEGAFTPVNTLDHDLFAVNSFWDQDRDRWEIRLFNFRNDSVLQTWPVERGGGWDLDHTNRQFENAPPVHSLVLPDRSVITKLEKTPNLIRLDPDGRVRWVNHDLVFHHAIQPDPDGTSFWVCAWNIPVRPDAPPVGRSVRNINGHTIPFVEDLIVRVDMGTGRILLKKGVPGILLDAHQESLLYGGGLDDPIHLNDIRPVHDSTAYWRPGDLFLSMKRRSTVLLYRVAENRIVDMISGPFISQHDVNPISDHEISIFNNRYITGLQYPRNMEARIPSLAVRDTLESSEVVIFDFRDRSFRSLYRNELQAEDMHTMTQGIQEVLPDGELFVEAQNSGRYYVIGPKGVVLRKVFPAPIDGYVHGPNWTRILPTLPRP